jgi:hypothetical protein
VGLARHSGGVMAAAALLAACSTGGSGQAPPTARSSTGVTTASGTVTSSPRVTPPPATTTTTEALIPQLTPEVAAKALFTAWGQGDRVGALHVATVEAVATLFAQAPQPFSDRGCQEPLAGHSACAFGVGAGLVQLETVTLAGGWVVQSVVINS